MAKESLSTDGLRDAYLRLDYILCMNELCKDQDWMKKFIEVAKRNVGRAIKALEPRRRLPSILHDTGLGQAVKEMNAKKKRRQRCIKNGTHEMKPCKGPPEMKFLKLNWKRCSTCGDCLGQ